MAQKKQPVTIWGIEFDALINDNITLSSTIPTYPVENGFTVSDTIINDPLKLSLTLYLTNTPVTWLYRHGSSADRVQNIVDELEAKWTAKELAKIVTPTAIYTDMGITSISIANTSERGYARQISIEAQKVLTTSRKTSLVPVTSSKSGTSGASGGTASTSEEDDSTKRSSILKGIFNGLTGN